MTLKELETYFAILKKQLASVDNVKLVRKWPKIVNGEVVEHPT